MNSEFKIIYKKHHQKHLHFKHNGDTMYTLGYLVYGNVSISENYNEIPFYAMKGFCIAYLLNPGNN